MKKFFAFFLAVIALTLTVSAADFTHKVVDCELTDIKLNTENITVSVGGNAQIYAEPVPVLANVNADLTFSSSDESVCSVTSTAGLVRGRAEGTAIVSVTNGTVTKQVSVTVTPKVTVDSSLYPADFDLGMSEITLYIGMSYRLSPTITPENANGDFITYSSSRPSICSVTSSGRLNPRSPGKTVITAQSGDIIRTVNVTVVANGPLYSVEGCIDGTPDWLNTSYNDPDYKAPDTIEIEGNNYSLSFVDYFDGSSLDLTKWAYAPEWQRKSRPGWWRNKASYLNGEGQYICDNFKTNDIMPGLEEKFPGVDYSYASGCIRTKGIHEQTYGYWEICWSIPQDVAGYWDSFWLIGDGVADVGEHGTTGLEVDIVEALPVTKGYHHTLHWDGYAADHKSIGGSAVSADLFTGYHTVGFLWTPDDYVFYVDGIESWRASSSTSEYRADLRTCEEPLYTKICCEFGNDGGTINETLLPGGPMVDYVRIYNLDEKNYRYSGSGTLKSPDDYTLGDVNNNGSINIADAMTLYKYVAGSSTEEINTYAADVSKDGKINIADAMILYRYVAGLISKF